MWDARPPSSCKAHFLPKSETLYQPPKFRQDFADNQARFAYFCKAASPPAPTSLSPEPHSNKLKKYHPTKARKQKPRGDALLFTPRLWRNRHKAVV